MEECLVLFSYFQYDAVTLQNYELLTRYGGFQVVPIYNDPLGQLKQLLPNSFDVRLFPDLLGSHYLLNRRELWQNVDLLIYIYGLYGNLAKRYLYLEWDTYVTIALKEVYKSTWDAPISATYNHYINGIGSKWSHFRFLSKPHRSFLGSHASGLSPLCGTLISAECLGSICEMLTSTVFRDMFRGMFCETRIASAATMNGYPLKSVEGLSSTVNWRRPPEITSPGLYHPIKRLVQ